MTNYQFNLLALDRQKAKVWDKGIFYQIENSLGLTFYGFFDFYAEVHLNNETNEIERVRTF